MFILFQLIFSTCFEELLILMMHQTKTKHQFSTLFISIFRNRKYFLYALKQIETLIAKAWFDQNRLLGLSCRKNILFSVGFAKRNGIIIPILWRTTAVPHFPAAVHSPEGATY